MPARVIEARSLSKHFGRRRAVDDVDLVLEAGECVALFGPNGAGKTTLLRLVAGLLKPTRGSVHVTGVDVRSDTRARSRVGLVSHQSMLYAPLTARENVVFFARLYGLPDPEASAMSALEVMRVADRADVPVRTLSRGLQQRVSIARAIVHRPGVILLDEPYAGLDESGASALTALLREQLALGAALVVITHNVSEGTALATQTAVMRNGRIDRMDNSARVAGLSHAG